MAARPSRLVLTLGVHGSASTWVFNVVRELLEAAHGTAAMAACYAGSAAEAAAAERPDAAAMVVKTHGWHGIDAFAQARAASGIVSVRDPRDAVFSLVQRFGERFEVALAGVVRDWHCVQRCLALGFPLLRYEDRFFDDKATVARLAAHLGLDVPEAEMGRIFEGYRTDAVRRLSAAVRGLPPEQRSGDSARLLVARQTLITHAHIGDGRFGKWRDLADAEQRDRMMRSFGEVLFWFGYPLV